MTTTSKFDSIEFYTALQMAERFIKDNIADGKECRMFIHGGYSSDCTPMIQICRGYASNEIKVEGKHLGEIVEEFNRRIEFDAKQVALTIGHTTVESDYVEQVPIMDNDEVPF